MPIGHTSIAIKKDSLVKGFVTRFISDDFFSNIINICLFPSDFGSISINNNSILDYLKQYFIDLIKSCKYSKINNIKQIENYVELLTTIINIRERGNTVINYSNILQHVPSIDVSQQQLIKYSLSNKLSDVTEFRKTIDNVISDINIYYEICSVSNGMTNFDTVTEIINKPGTSPHEAAKLYKDAIIDQYNELSKLQSISKTESEKDYFVISDKESINDLAKSLTDYISGDYTFYESGYTLFDSNIEGLTFKALLKLLELLGNLYQTISSPFWVQRLFNLEV